VRRHSPAEADARSSDDCSLRLCFAVRVGVSDVSSDVFLDATLLAISGGDGRKHDRRRVAGGDEDGERLSVVEWRDTLDWREALVDE
jgi:hypothetical protein